jgi:hypothetical protein
MNHKTPDINLETPQSHSPIAMTQSSASKLIIVPLLMQAFNHQKAKLSKQVNKHRLEDFNFASLSLRSLRHSRLEVEPEWVMGKECPTSSRLARCLGYRAQRSCNEQLGCQNELVPARILADLSEALQRLAKDPHIPTTFKPPTCVFRNTMG